MTLSRVLLTLSAFLPASLIGGVRREPPPRRQAPSSSVAPAPTPAPAPAPVVRLQPAADGLIPADARLERIATGFHWTEGPLWLPSGKLLFAEIASNSIRTWSPAGVQIFLQPSGYKGTAPYAGPEPGSNAMTFDRSGRVSVAGHAQRDVWRFDRLDPHAPVTILADSFHGHRLNSPNDLVYRSDGSLYFTDPPYGLPTQSDADPAKELPFCGVYRIPGAAAQKADTPPARDRLQLVLRDLPHPNGLAFSPDEKFLYIDNSEPDMFWMRYTVHPDGSLTDGVKFAAAGRYTHHGAPDGMKVDRQGNLYSAGPGGVWIFSSAGIHLATIPVPEVVGNVAWGDADHKTLYITASTSLYRIRLTVPGIVPTTPLPPLPPPTPVIFRP